MPWKKVNVMQKPKFWTILLTEFTFWHTILTFCQTASTFMPWTWTGVTHTCIYRQKTAGLSPLITKKLKKKATQILDNCSSTAQIRDTHMCRSRYTRTLIHCRCMVRWNEMKSWLLLCTPAQLNYEILYVAGQQQQQQQQQLTVGVQPVTPRKTAICIEGFT